MKQDKTRKDFYLEEDYDAYRAQFALKAFLAENSTAAIQSAMGKPLELAADIHSSSYSSGYASAELDTAENS